MNNKLGKISATSLLILMVSTAVILGIMPFVSATPQTITINVTDNKGNELTNATIQVLELRPQGGFQEVTRLYTTNGLVTITNLTRLQSLAHSWISYMGAAQAKYSTPNIVLFITYVDANGNTFFKTDSIPMGVTDVVNGMSYSKNVVLNLSDKPAFTQIETISGHSGVSPDSYQPPPPTGAPYYFWALNSTVIYPNPNPISNYTQVPVAWFNVPGGSTAYGTMIYAMLSQTSTNFELGVALGTGYSLSPTSTFEIGSSGWTLSNYSTFQIPTTIQPPNSWSTIYVNGSYEADKWQEEYQVGSTIYYTNNWAETMLVSNIQAPNGNIQGGILTNSPPPAWANYTQYSYQFYSNVTGSGSSLQHLAYNVSSLQFVKTFYQNDVTYYNIGIPVGAILLTLLGQPELALAVGTALSMSASWVGSTSSISLASLWYDGPSGSHVNLYADVGTASYTTSNGQNGTCPIFGIQLDAFPATPGVQTILNATSVTLGQNVTDEAIVWGLPAPPNPVPTGTVQFYWKLGNGNWNALGSPLAAPVAYSPSFKPNQTGTYYLMANYSGDSNYTAASSSPEVLTVNATTLWVQTTLNASTITLGQNITDQAIVWGSPAPPYPGPTGTVQFYYSFNNSNWIAVGTSQTAPNANSPAFQPIYAGTYYFKAAYSGDSNYLPANSSNETFTVNPWTPGVQTILSASNITLGQNITDQAIVWGLPNPPYPNPTGFVQFYWKLGNGSWTALGSRVSLVYGVANSTSFKPSQKGTYYFMAAYYGDSNYLPNNSTSEVFTVN